jgi:hypothetical protein
MIIMSSKENPTPEEWERIKTLIKDLKCTARDCGQNPTFSEPPLTMISCCHTELRDLIEKTLRDAGENGIITVH